MEYTYQQTPTNGNFQNPSPCPEVTMQDASHLVYVDQPTTDHWSHQLLADFQKFVQHQAPPITISTSFEGECVDVEMVDATSSDNNATTMDFVMCDAVEEAMQIVVEVPLIGLGDCQMVDAQHYDGDWLMAY